MWMRQCSGVTKGRTAPGDTPQGVTPEGKKLWANLQRIVEKRGRTGKKGAVSPTLVTPLVTV